MPLKQPVMHVQTVKKMTLLTMKFKVQDYYTYIHVMRRAIIVFWRAYNMYTCHTRACMSKCFIFTRAM